MHSKDKQELTVLIQLVNAIAFVSNGTPDDKRLARLRTQSAGPESKSDIKVFSFGRKVERREANIDSSDTCRNATLGSFLSRTQSASKRALIAIRYARLSIYQIHLESQPVRSGRETMKSSPSHRFTESAALVSSSALTRPCDLYFSERCLCCYRCVWFSSTSFTCSFSFFFSPLVFRSNKQTKQESGETKRGTTHEYHYTICWERIMFAARDLNNER